METPICIDMKEEPTAVVEAQLSHHRLFRRFPEMGQNVMSFAENHVMDTTNMGEKHGHGNIRYVSNHINYIAGP